MAFDMRRYLENSTMDYRTVFGEGDYLVAECGFYRIYCSGDLAVIQYKDTCQHERYVYSPAFASALDRVRTGESL